MVVRDGAIYKYVYRNVIFFFYRFRLEREVRTCRWIAEKRKKLVPFFFDTFPGSKCCKL